MGRDPWFGAMHRATARDARDARDVDARASSRADAVSNEGWSNARGRRGWRCR